MEDRVYITPQTEDVVFVCPYTPEMPFYCHICGISYCDGEYFISRKKSNIYCIEYVISGTGTVKTNGKTFYPKKGDVYMLMKDKEHIYYSDKKEPWTKIWFNISGSLADKLMRIYNPAGETLFENADVYDEFAEFIEMAKNKNMPGKKIMDECSVIFHRILIKLQKIQPKTESDAVRDYIDAHICEPIRIEDLASLIYRSRSQTIRIFKKRYGITPYQYILNGKAEAAKSMLLNTNMSVKEIAFELSFADEHYFSNVFKKITGMTPKKYKTSKI